MPIYFAGSVPNPNPRKFTSIWSDERKFAAVLFETKAGKLKPLDHWKPGSILDFGFKKILEGWESEEKLFQITVNAFTGIEDRNHPIGKILKRRVHVEQPITMLEGLAAWHDATESEDFSWGEYKGRNQLQEFLRRGEADDLLTMAFLQGVARPARSWQYAGSVVERPKG